MVGLVQAEAAQQQENSLEALTMAVAEAKAKQDEAERTRSQERYSPHALCPLQPWLCCRPQTRGPFLRRSAAEKAAAAAAREIENLRAVRHTPKHNHACQLS